MDNCVLGWVLVRRCTLAVRNWPDDAVLAVSWDWSTVGKPELLCDTAHGSRRPEALAVAYVRSRVWEKTVQLRTAAALWRVIEVWETWKLEKCRLD